MFRKDFHLHIFKQQHISYAKDFADISRIFEKYIVISRVISHGMKSVL